jgi:opacity protein-like surface antigen
LAYSDPSGYGVELSYFNVLGLKVAKATGPENPGQWLVMKAPGTFWQTQDYAYQSMVWQDDTRLHSLEANARLDLSPRMTLLVGVRWLQLSDKLEGTLSPADFGQPLWKYSVPSTLSDAVPISGSPIVVNPPFWTTYTTNNLYGVQIGAKATIWEVGRFSVEGAIKAGVYDNRANQTTLVSLEKQIHPAHSATNAAAFVGEGGLVVKYQLTDGVAVKLGYEALWFNGVALAPGQIQKIATTQSSVSALGVNCRSTMLFQGMTFGLEYAF